MSKALESDKTVQSMKIRLRYMEISDGQSFIFSAKPDDTFRELRTFATKAFSIRSVDFLKGEWIASQIAHLWIPYPHSRWACWFVGFPPKKIEYSPDQKLSSLLSNREVVTVRVASTDAEPEDENGDCPMCFKPLESWVAAEPCGHKVCTDCAMEQFLGRYREECVICRGKIRHFWHGNRRIPMPPLVPQIVNPKYQNRQHVNDKGEPISLAEHTSRQRDKVPKNDLPTWEELANGDACAACLFHGASSKVVLCDDCDGAFHPKCTTTLCNLSEAQIENLPNFYCSVCRPTWTTGLPTTLFPDKREKLGTSCNPAHERARSHSSPSTSPGRSIAAASWNLAQGFGHRGARADSRIGQYRSPRCS